MSRRLHRKHRWEKIFSVTICGKTKKERFDWKKLSQVVAKLDEEVDEFKKAKTDGRKNLINLPITKSFSIPHNVVGNFGACQKK